MQRAIIPAVVAAIVLVLASTSAFVQGPAVRLSIDCAEANESVTVFNDTDAAITVRSITSLVNPRPGEEPYERNDSVAAGSSVSYSFGRAAGSAGAIRVSTNSIFLDDSTREGVRVQTSVGTVEALCSAGVGTLAVGPAGGTTIAPTLPPASTPTTTSVVDEPGVTAVVGTGGDPIPVPVAAVEPGPPFAGKGTPALGPAQTPALAPAQAPGKAGAAPGQLPGAPVAATRIIEFQPAGVTGTRSAGSAGPGPWRAAKPAPIVVRRATPSTIRASARLTRLPSFASITRSTAPAC